MPLEIVDEYRESPFAQRQTGLLFNLPVPVPEREQLPEGISLCMIVKNEERFLAECLASVRDCVDEINIVDTGSTDRTVEIALAHGANVIHREWRNDFAWARNEALAMATRRWTLVLDADEEIVAESVPVTRALRGVPADLTAIYMGIVNVVNDESGAASMTHFLPRLFPTNPRLRYCNVIHENLALDGNERQVPVVLSPIRILHKGYTAEILVDRDKEARNAPLLDRAIREDAGNPFSWFNFGVSAIANGNFDAGIDALEKMFAMADVSRSFHPVAFFVLASGYAEGRKDLERALEVIETGIDAWPHHANLAFQRGWLLSLAGRYDDARAEYERALTLRPYAHLNFMTDDEIFVWKSAYNLGSTYLKEGRSEEAVPWFEQALANKRDSAMLRNVTAVAYERVGRTFEAERLFRDAVERNEGGAFVSYVNFLLRRRRFAQALDLLERGDESLPDADLAALYISAATAMHVEKLGDPEPYARRALALAPGDARTVTLLDTLYAERGDAAARARLRVDELLTTPVDAAGFARRSHRLLEEMRLDDALAAAEAGLALAPQDAVLRYNAALAAARIGSDAAARAHLAQIAPGDALSAPALVLAVDIALRAGDLDAAIAAFEGVRERDARHDANVRDAGVRLTGTLIEAGRLGDAGRVAAALLD